MSLWCGMSLIDRLVKIGSDDGVIRRSAILSPDGRYRYQLTRRWDDNSAHLPPLLFVMLNPSTADAERDDPTIRRCMGFARNLGYPGITVMNLYAYRATNPAELAHVDDPVGPENDELLSIRFDVAARACRPVVAAWGVKAPAARVAEVVTLAGLQGAVGCLCALGVTAGGAPKHPLARGRHRIPDGAPLRSWSSLEFKGGAA